MNARLTRAFRATAYEAEGAVARIGRRSPALDALLARHGVRRAGFITAWNPWSRAMPWGWNDRMQDRLRQVVAGRVIGEGWGRGRAWAEHHLLVAGEPARLQGLARRFRQHAIVMVEHGRPARLLAA